jgi:WD40 repeat protein
VSGEQAIGEPLGQADELITDVAFSPDGTRLVAARFDPPTVIYDAATRRETVRIRTASIVSAVAFDPDGKRVAVGTIDGKVGFFDATSGAAVGPPVDAGNAVWQAAFSPDGKLLAIAVDPNGVDGFYRQRRQGTVQLVDVESGHRVGRPIVPGAGTVFALAFSRDGKLLATSSYAGHVDLWDVATQARHGKPMTVADDGLPAVAFDPGGRFVAAGGATGPVRVWRVADQQPAYPPLAGHTGPVTGVAFDPTGSFLASSSVLGGTRLWDAQTGVPYGDELVASPAPTPSVELPPFLGVRSAFSPDGKRLAVAGVGVRAMLWDVDPAEWRRRACAIAGRNLSREEWTLYLPSGTPYRSTCPDWPAG